MKRSIIVLLVSLMSGCMLYAQQDAQFALFPWAMPYYNVGAVGEQSNTLCFTGLFRQQYTGFKDTYIDESGKTVSDNTSPQQLLFNIESYLKKLHGGLGVSIIKDKIGYYNNVGVKIGYSYKLRIPTGSLGIGLQVGFLNQKLDASKLRPLQGGDQVITNFKGEESWLDMDVNFGLYYKGEHWYAGLSGTQLIENVRLSGDKNVLQMTRHMYIHGGYTWTIPQNPNWEIEPQTLIKTDFSTAQWDLILMARYNKILWMGLSYRIQDAVSVLFGARPFFNSSNNYLKGIDLGFAYSFTTSKLGYSKNRSYGDFEIMIRYCFDIFKTETFEGYGSTRSIYKNQY
ncbi:MAG: PorP/SprF family type IX secretion system membrane protein [Bacteroidales bacterium]|nr:PorP/SprF family type IX secretion system membrane protein [Bacteroidales bacterium]MBQ7490902.1 PorP/SprF family type IX secretion system membrane protein [Bacteroidales bacterium]